MDSLSAFRDLASTNTLLALALFFVPGFAGLKVYELLIPSASRNLGNISLEIISYSILSWGLLLPLLLVATALGNWSANALSLSVAFLFGGMVFPALLAWGLVQARTKWLAGTLLHPSPTAWDYLFASGCKVWVLITRSDGTQFGGVVGFATSFPNPQELYIEQLWRVDSERGFTDPVEGSAGLFVRRDEVETMEFFHYEAD